MAQRDILRISREIADIQKGTDLSIAVACQEHDLRHVKALIIGPPGTPYEYGFFEFAVKFGPEYPSKAPKVDAKTTNSGRCRFNPNIYAGGKVCLSILGTWQGESGEQWSSAQGLESVLLSIQSLMSNNPYENEPGFEKSKGDEDKEAREAYCAKIRHETLRIAVIQNMENNLQIQSDGALVTSDKSDTPQWDDLDSDDESLQKPKQDNESAKFEPFIDLQKRRFLWYYDSYLAAIAINAPKHKEGSPFTKMPFESSSNGMAGRFQYAKLRIRLIRIKEVLDEETDAWSRDGLKAVEQDLTTAYNLQNQFNQFITFQKQKNIHNIDVGLLDSNPFVWILTYFGRSASNLDGGIFRVRISLSPRFPEEQPRVRFETRIYHHRVSSEGTLCYFATKPDEVKHHIAAIVLAIEEVSPPYDPRAIVNPEATKLYWGTDAERKQYNRAQRRSAQASVEDGIA